MRIHLPVAICLIVSHLGFSQVTNRENYDLKSPGKDIAKKCEDLFHTLNTMPDDARFSTFIKGDSILLTHSDADWFWKLIPSKNDGVAIDLVFKEQYNCDDNIQRFSQSWSHKGFLMPPLYRDDIRNNLIPVKRGYVAVFVGRIPGTWKTESIEPNHILLENKNICYYSNIVNVDYHGWDLLKNGLYYDTLNVGSMEERYRDISKTLNFTIPFEKDKWEYKDSDVRPLYDSLRITDYAIKDIRIRTYTSVEGSVERNQKLQRLRAESIVHALQSFQPEKLGSSIFTSENWVEFLEDISKTPFNALAGLSKNEIKEKLKSPELLTRMEPILARHRKAIIELDLEKRVPYLHATGGELKKYFNQQVADHHLSEALQLQQIIFYKIDRHELPSQFLSEIEVPEKLEFGSLLINNASFRYENSFTSVSEAIDAFEKLDALLPNNARIRYNLCALRLRSWLASQQPDPNATLKKQIDALSKLGISDVLVRRLQINYFIILSELHLRQKNYAEKDKAIKFIFDSYRRLKLNDEDLLNLAKYFSHNSKFDWSKLILQARVKAIDASEDLIFYYLSLTIFDERNTKNPSYRTIMLNAINIDHERFCKLFDSREKGGVTFQLLNDPFLKKTYCENCNQ